MNSIPHISVDRYDPEEADVRYMLPFFDQLLPCLPRKLRKILYLGARFEQVKSSLHTQFVLDFAQVSYIQIE